MENENKGARPRGAPGKYKPEYAEMARRFCLLDGATDQELAEAFGVSAKTIANWGKQHPDFLQAVSEGKKIADARVAEGLYKRATGYRYEEVTFEKIDDKVTLEISPNALITQEAYKKKVVVKELPPDPGAALNWLKNRQPAKWRDKVQVEHSGTITGELSNLSDEQLSRLAADLEAKLSVNHGSG